ncbi:MAG: GntR family transcriptional regulator [Paracoccaceae bacterium]|uniref:GntR family transcriptional regulator n=1 Tax=Seohaeicola saemankumensis TaxID=481181 RepID=UPI001E2BB056|nr:GntR family transcriptional regulator [Seohaeicola saemankumensis]MCD1624887.1 GntR family transcriptional regulator [Seohaeicola saemankumensis]
MSDHSDARSRFLRLHDALRTRICMLDYPPGTRLSEETLAAEFGTSRTPLRRVLARLEDEGLVISQHGVGTIVTDVDAEEMARTYDLRRELAGLVGRLSPVPVSDEIIKEAADFLDAGKILLKQPDTRALAELNMDYFHFGTSLTNNLALREMSERLYYRTARIWLTATPRLDLAEETAIFVSELRDSFQALVARDGQAAADVRRAHISLCIARLNRHMA